MSAPSPSPSSAPAAPALRPHSRFAVDAITQRLVREGSAASTYGFNANLFSMELAALRAPYEAFASRLAEAMAGCGEPYIYPFAHVHVTAGSPTPFTHTQLAGAERARFEAAFLAAARDECVAEKGFPAAPFPVVVGEEVRLDRQCGIMLCGDPTGAVARIRACLRACMAHPAVAALGADVVARAAFKHPNIVHASFLRFVADPRADVSDDDIAERFARVARTWAPVTVMADALYFVRELRPYMHLHIGPDDRPGEDAACVVAALPYAPRGAPAEAPAAAT
jgi:hypothetical protein